MDTENTNYAAEKVAEHLSHLTLKELATLGRPDTPKGRPNAVFVRCDGTNFIYHVRGKSFQEHQRAEVRRLMTPAQAGTEEERKAASLANAKKLDKMLLREHAVSREVVARRAAGKISDKLKSDAVSRAEKAAHDAEDNTGTNTNTNTDTPEA